MRKQILSRIRRVVIKVGTMVLLDEELKVCESIFYSLATQISNLMNDGKKVVLVSSGAIAFGKHIFGSNQTMNIPQKQAAAAVGQIKLMSAYKKAFSEHNIDVAQILLTWDDFSHRKRFLNAKNTILSLVDRGILPIVNENDSVAVEEIKVGDNDNLSALLVNLFSADLLLILTDVDGVFDSDPKKKGAHLLSLVEEIDEGLERRIKRSKSKLGTGGMLTKIEAAKKAQNFGAYTIVANGKIKDVISRIFSGEEIGTLFLPKKLPLKSRKHWLLYTQKPTGKVILDKGAKEAILKNGKSLLPWGITRIVGNFTKGECIVCTDELGEEIAKGISNYSSDELRKIIAEKKNNCHKIRKDQKKVEVIHRDNLVITV